MTVTDRCVNTGRNRNRVSTDYYLSPNKGHQYDVFHHENVQSVFASGCVLCSFNTRPRRPLGEILGGKECQTI